MSWVRQKAAQKNEAGAKRCFGLPTTQKDDLIMTHFSSGRKLSLLPHDPDHARLEQDAEADGASDAIAGVAMPDYPSMAYMRGYCQGLEAVIRDQQRMLDEFAMQPTPVDDALTF
jgi:hypothetical protein